MADKPRVLTNEMVFPWDGTMQPRARWAAATVRFYGATGLVGTAFGIPGMSATRVATGHYRVHMPRAPNLSQKFSFTPMAAIPTAYQGQGPTGIGFGVVGANRAPASGTVDFFTTRGHPTATDTRLTQGIPVNPDAGSEVDVFVFTTPYTQY